MNYWELRSIVSKILPRRQILSSFNRKFRSAVKEKGRKKNYHQFDLFDNKWKKHERLLNTEEFRNFIEVSLRASACPMPLNVDVWDGLLCGFGCKYCFADAFRASLYTSFFDNSKSVGLRSCSSEYFKPELDKYLENRFRNNLNISEIQKAINNNIPIRIGIRFEDFLPKEKKKGVTLELLKYLRQAKYPVMINSKSSMPGEDPYIKELSDNPSKSAVHITLISSDDKILKQIEPGAPSFDRRLKAMKNMVSAGIRVVARIEPYMVFMNDSKDKVDEYIEKVYQAGVRHITFDTYSYSANNPGIRDNFVRLGYDFQRMFILTSDSQPIGSLLLGKFMDLFEEKGFSCSTFDLGNVPRNNDTVCCEVGDWFDKSKFNIGSAVGAIRYIKSKKGKNVFWTEYEKYINDNGGFLSESLRKDIYGLWNLKGHSAYYISWAQGIIPAGEDERGNLVWTYDSNDDFRKRILEAVI